MQRLVTEKKSAIKFVERRYEHWDENYELYRNKTRLNRLTQRQNVNIPLMQETIKTLLSKIDDSPTVDWKELSGDADKEIIFQEKWNDDFERLNLELVDIVDKKTNLLYGRAFKKLNWVDDGIDIQAMDIYDVLVDPLTNPIDLETARFVIHQNIFRTYDEIMSNDKYTKEGKDALRSYMNNSDVVIQSSQNREEWQKRIERLKQMGLTQDDDQTFSAGTTIINLTEHYTKIWNKSKKDYEIHVVVYANDTVALMDEKLVDLIGVEFYPFVTWAEDLESQDFWSDAVADLVRTPNKVLNAWFSQLVENRTLRNFQMHWYDATNQNYIPQTYEPGPGRMLPAPGDPNKTIMPVDISGLDETLNAINFLTQIIERGTSATSIEKGVSEPGQTTLGEVQLLVGKAQERTVAMSKMYRRSWLELANKYYKMQDANASGSQTLYKMGVNDKIYSKTVYTTDWKSKVGYKAMVTSSSEQEAETTKGLQKFQFVLSQFPMNVPLRKIAQKRMLELVDLSPQELKEVEDFEKKLAEMPQQPQGMTPMQPQAMQPQVPQPVMSKPNAPAVG